MSKEAYITIRTTKEKKEEIQKAANKVTRKISNYLLSLYEEKKQQKT